MEKVTGHPRLYRRGAVYYHRAAVPVDIKATYPKVEETFSLKTTDRAEALRRVRIEAVRVDRLFEEHRQQLKRAAEPAVEELTPAQLKHIEDAYYACLLDEDEEVRLSAFEGMSFEEYGDTVEALDEVNRHDYARGEPGVFFRGEAEEVLTWSNVDIRLAEGSPSWPKVIRALQQATIRAAKAKQERNRGEVVETPPVPTGPLQANGHAITEQAPQDGPLLSVLVEDWAMEKARTSWVRKTVNGHRVAMAHFISVAGDHPLASYGRAEARAFKAVLMSLPANWNKKPALKKLSIGDAAKRARELGMTPMSDENVNKLIGCVSSFWTWARDHFDDCPENPFRGLRIKNRKRNVRDERDPFSVEELRVMFAAPLYTGCKSFREWKHPGTMVLRDAGRFWVPLISLFTGARAGEIIQLYTGDVREEQGIRFFDINDDGDDKGLKTVHSRRRIPVHQALVDLGFLDFVEERRRKDEQRLFPDCEKGSDGYYSSPFSKWFARFLKAVRVKRGTNAFHSFRHSFEDACREAGIPKEVMDALQGHGEEGMSARYGRGFVLRRLAEEMAKLRYDELDLSHLKPS